MSDAPRTIEVKVYTELHDSEPTSEVQRIVWETLDTAWKLLSEGAVRVTLAEMRRTVEEQGVPFPSDEELFEGAPDGVDSYADLAPSVDAAGEMLEDAFRLLSERALDDAVAGLSE